MDEVIRSLFDESWMIDFIVSEFSLSFFIVEMGESLEASFWSCFASTGSGILMSSHASVGMLNESLSRIGVWSVDFCGN